MGGLNATGDDFPHIQVGPAENREIPVSGLCNDVISKVTTEKKLSSKIKRHSFENHQWKFLTRFQAPARLFLS